MFIDLELNIFSEFSLMFHISEEGGRKTNNLGEERKGKEVIITLSYV